MAVHLATITVNTRLTDSLDPNRYVVRLLSSGPSTKRLRQTLLTCYYSELAVPSVKISQNILQYGVPFNFTSRHAATGPH